MFYKLKKVFLIFFCALLCVSCAGKKITFDETHPLALAPDVQWALITVPYAAFREDTDWESNILGHCRKGDILQVKGTAVYNGKENWYYFIGGWLPESSLNIYSNRLKAETAAGQLK